MGTCMPRQKKYSDTDILDMLKDCKDRHGKCTPALFREHDEYCSVSLILSRFGSWSEAKKEAGIDEDLSNETGRSQQYTDTQILKHLKELERREGKVTTQALLEHDDLVGPTAVVERFGSWMEAKKQAGIDTDGRSRNSRPQQFTDEEMKEELRRCKKKHGKVTQDIIDSDDEFASSGAFRKRFGSWSEAKEVAGLGETPRSKYTDEELLDMMRECKDRYKKCTANVFADDDDFCSPETITRRLGSWNRAKERAGIE